MFKKISQIIFFAFGMPIVSALAVQLIPIYLLLSADDTHNDINILILLPALIVMAFYQLFIPSLLTGMVAVNLHFDNKSTNYILLLLCVLIFAPIYFYILFPIGRGYDHLNYGLLIFSSAIIGYRFYFKSQKPIDDEELESI